MLPLLTAVILFMPRAVTIMLIRQPKKARPLKTIEQRSTLLAVAVHAS